jgi:hypothetical protein
MDAALDQRNRRSAYAPRMAGAAGQAEPNARAQLPGLTPAASDALADAVVPEGQIEVPDRFLERA